MADGATGMLVTTKRTMLAEPTGIPWTLSCFTVRVNMQIKAFGVVAFTILGKEPTIGHSLQIILMQELAIIAFLTESTQPMLTDYSFFSSISVKNLVAMLLRAGCASQAEAFQE